MQTLLLSVLAGVLALVLGVVLATMRVSPIPPLRGLATFYVETFRNTPLTVVFFFVLFGLPQIDTVVSFFTGSVIAVGCTPRPSSPRPCGRASTPCRGPGGGRPRPGVGFRSVAARGRAPAGLPHRRPAAGQRLHRDGQEHLDRGRLLGQRAVLDAPAPGQRQRRDLLLVLLGVVVGYMIITVPMAYAVNRLERRVAILR